MSCVTSMSTNFQASISIATWFSICWKKSSQNSMSISRNTISWSRCMLLIGSFAFSPPWSLCTSGQIFSTYSWDSTGPSFTGCVSPYWPTSSRSSWRKMTSRGSCIISNSKTLLKSRDNNRRTSATKRPVRSCLMRPPGSLLRALISKAPKMFLHLRIQVERYSKAKRSYSSRESWILSRESR